MIDKTSGISFQKFGSVYDEKMIIDPDKLICRELHSTGKIVNHMYQFSCEVYIELVEGLAMLLVGNSLEKNELQTFSIHHYIKIEPNKYFNIIALSNDISCYIITPSNYSFKSDFLNPPYVYHTIIPNINIKEILGYYYVIKSPKYRFNGESHNYYELTYVDHGSLDTTVEGKTYTLESYDLMLYGPGQFHTQQIVTDSSCSYLTVVFDVHIDDDSQILNRVFHCNNELHNILKKFVSESSADIKYSNNLMLCHLQEIIILLLQYDTFNSNAQTITNCSSQYFQDTLLKQILDYIESKITEPLTIEEICHKFSISRSSLQALFKNNLNISPKNYMIELKLKKSKELIRTNKYTISEIALMLGFSSIHYFSRTFKQHFDITPSEYAKKIYK